MAGMRDKVIHVYFGVKIERVWKIVKRNISNLKPKFEKMSIEEVKRLTAGISCDGGYSAVFRTLPFGSLNRKICGFAFGYAQISLRETSYVRLPSSEIVLSEKLKERR